MEKGYPKSKVLLALAAGLIAFGFAPILVRATPETSPLVLASYRTVLAVLLLVPYWLYKRTKKALSETKKENLWVAFAGICLGLHFCCWIASLYYTSVASASVLVTIHPVILILVERLWFKRSFAKTTWIGVFLAFAGSVILGISDSQIEQDFSDPLFGNFLAFSAALIFVVYLLIGQKIRQNREWVDYVFPVYLFSAISCVMLSLAVGDDLTNISLKGAAVGFGLAIGPQIMGHGSMNFAVKYVSPTLLSTLILVEPLFASVLAFFLFAELPPITSIIAMSIILVGVGLTWKRKSTK
ncbi:MAG: DMT family transporter [Balneolaceae bacterium]|nr:DMT family transporter [Balneolaceae bacterium]